MGERISAKRQKGMEIRVDAQSQLKEASHSCFQAESPSFLLFLKTDQVFSSYLTLNDENEDAIY